jgi:uncharacterized membrane protein
MDMIQSKVTQFIMGVSAFCGFMGSYFMDLTANNTEQYLAVICVMLLDGFFGIIAGIKREGFKTYKAIKVLKNTILLGILISNSHSFSRIRI